MAGMSNWLRNKIVDFVDRAIPWTPPATTYIALCSSAPSPGTAGTELTGTGYARIAVAKSAANMAATNGATLTTNPSTGTTGTTSNNSIIDWGTAGAGGWGTASHWEEYDAITGGNRMSYGTIVDGSDVAAPRSIAAGDPVSFPISALRKVYS